jgi:L-threonylcarbamoyladenylate synthase
MPSNEIARELIELSGVPIAAPSANTSGKPSPTRASHVIKDLSGKIDMIIEDDTVDIGVESTIIDLSEEVPTILRPGYITKEMFEEVIGGVRIDPAITEGVKSGVVPKAPGMKYKHYAPDADLKIVEGDEAKVVEYINDNVNRLISQGYKVAVMTTEEGKHNYNKGIIVSMGHKDDELSAARHLYAVLREFDNENVDYVFSESFETENVGRAVMNRLIKAAGHTIINV